MFYSSFDTGGTATSTKCSICYAGFNGVYGATGTIGITYTGGTSAAIYSNVTHVANGDTGVHLVVFCLVTPVTV